MNTRNFFQTKFFHEPTLRMLEMDVCTRQLLVHGGLGDFLDKNAPTYSGLVKEFLATLSVRSTSIEFRLLGREFTRTKERVGQLFGVTAAPTAGWFDVSKGEGPVAFWLAVTRVPFEAKKGQYNSSIRHPALRLIHKVLANTFFAQAEVNKISLRDMSYLWCLTPESPVIPGWVDLFLFNCKDIIDKRKTATISFGGLITLIARDCIDLSVVPDALHGSFLYDEAQLRKAGHLEGRAPMWVWRTGHLGVIQLRLPRQLPFGPTAEDFFMGDEDEDDEDEDEDGGDDDDQGDDGGVPEMQTDVGGGDAGPSGTSGVGAGPDYYELQQRMTAMSLRQDTMWEQQQQMAVLQDTMWQHQQMISRRQDDMWDHQQQLYVDIGDIRRDVRGLTTSMADMVESQAEMRRLQEQVLQRQQAAWEAQELQRQRQEEFFRFAYPQFPPYPPPPPQ